MSEYELYHHGVKGQKWGVRRDKYLARMARNNAKIEKNQQKLHTTGAMKRKERAAKAQAKLDRYERRAAKGRKRLAQGKSISNRQQKAIIKAEKYKAQVAKNSAKNDKYEQNIARLERKNARLQKRVDRLNKKIANEKMTSPSIQKNASVGKEAIKNNPKLKAAMNTKVDKLNRAKSSGIYSLDFLEVTQNKNLSNKKMLSEYDKYLDNPQKYRTETVKRLKDN